MTIWKYELYIDDEQLVKMPIGGQILTVQIQNGKPCIWVLINPNAPTKDRKLIINGTGHEVNHGGKYIGTFQLGMLVFHVFDGGYIE